MGSEHSDEVEDVGRKESENQIKNKMSSKYLEDVIEQTGLEYDQAVELIERRKKAGDDWEKGFVSDFDLMTKEVYYDPYDPYLHYNSVVSGAMDQALNVHEKAEQALSKGRGGGAQLTSLRQACLAEQERVIQILKAGKRTFEKDVDNVEQQTKAVQFKDENLEVNQQAEVVFGFEQKQDRQGTDKALKYMEKGVKKMTKGLDSDS